MIKDLTGQRFGRLTALSPTEQVVRESRIWLCRCDCGEVKAVRRKDLTGKRRTKSCGCLKRGNCIEGRGAVTRTHGDTNSVEYNVWCTMKRRCTSPKATDFQHYGGRGITVCERWKSSYENFFEDMGRRPSPKHSIDRIDNNGNYEPKNCKWSTRVEQQSNTRRNRYITIDGVTNTLAHWLRIYEISESIYYWRVKHSQTPSQALMTPVRQWDRKPVEHAAR